MIDSRKYVIRPINVVFHLLDILVKVVDPLAIRICLTLFSNLFKLSSSTRINAWAVISLVFSFCNFQTPSFCVNYSFNALIFGRILNSKPHIEKSKLGLSLEYTDTKEFSQLMVVIHRGSLFLISQKALLPKFTSCFINLIRQSLGQHFLLLYPTIFSLFGSGFSVKYLCINSLDSSEVNLNMMYSVSMYLM